MSQIPLRGGQRRYLRIGVRSQVLFVTLGDKRKPLGNGEAASDRFKVCRTSRGLSFWTRLAPHCSGTEQSQTSSTYLCLSELEQDDLPMEICDVVMTGRAQ